MINWIVHIIKRIKTTFSYYDGIDIYPDKVIIRLHAFDKYNIRQTDIDGAKVTRWCGPGEITIHLDGPGIITFPGTETIPANLTVTKEPIETWPSDYLALRAMYPNAKIEKVSEGPGIEKCFWKVSGTWEAESESESKPPKPPKPPENVARTVENCNNHREVHRLLRRPTND